MRHGKKNFSRSDRVKEQILREMATLLRTGLKDPRSGYITVTHVDLTQDYSHAKIWYTVLDENTKDATREALEHAKGYLRSELAKRLTLYKTPELHFHYDDTIEKGMSISSLIEQVSKEPPVED